MFIFSIFDLLELHCAEDQHCAEYDIRRLFSHSSPAGGKFTVLTLKSFRCVYTCARVCAVTFRPSFDVHIIMPARTSVMWKLPLNFRNMSDSLTIRSVHFGSLPWIRHALTHSTGHPSLPLVTEDKDLRHSSELKATLTEHKSEVWLWMWVLVGMRASLATYVSFFFIHVVMP